MIFPFEQGRMGYIYRAEGFQMVAQRHPLNEVGHRRPKADGTLSP